jgi:hypothetical protein
MAVFELVGVKQIGRSFTSTEIKIKMKMQKG